MQCGSHQYALFLSPGKRMLLLASLLETALGTRLAIPEAP